MVDQSEALEHTTELTDMLLHLLLGNIYENKFICNKNIKQQFPLEYKGYTKNCLQTGSTKERGGENSFFFPFPWLSENYKGSYYCGHG